jgi:hypothetical protein
MKQFFRLPYSVTKRTKLQALQYKVLNKIINCNYWLNKIHIKDAPTCRFCDLEETVEHYFYACIITKQFWYAFQSWWNRNSGTNINIIYEKDVIMGYKREEDNFKVFNCCLLIGKAMIYKQKSINIQPDIYAFLCELKEFLNIEKQIANTQTDLDSVSDEWGDILEI